MKKTYNFKGWLDYKPKGPVLTIRPFSPRRDKPVPYPVMFKELNIPVEINGESKGDNFNLTYSLDFERSYNGESEFICIGKKKLISVLNDFVVYADEDLKGALSKKEKINGKKFSFISDDGLERNVKFSRQGNTRKSQRFVCSENNKALFI